MSQPLSDIANVQISTSGGSLSLPGFGVPMILGAYLKAWAERIRFYTDLPGVAVDFATTDPEYLAAAQIFGQTPHPAKIAIGRGTRKPTQVFKIYVPADGALPQVATKHALTIAGVEVSFTSDATPTQAEVATGLTAAINVGTATHGLTAVKDVGDAFITVTKGTVGAWTRVALPDVAPAVHLCTLESTVVDPGVEADLNEIAAENGGFYALAGFAFPSSAVSVRLAEWAKANERLNLVDSFDTAIPGVADAGATDVAHVLKVAAYSRTSLWYHPDAGAFLSAAVAGRCLPFDAGSETWGLKTLDGVASTNFTATQIANMVAKNANWFNEIAGRNVTSPTSGKVSANEWIDTVRARDSMKIDMQAAIFARLSDPTVKKIPYTDKGATVVAAEVASTLKDYEDRGFLVPGSSDVVVPAVSAQTTQNRAARNFAGISFTGKIAGAIHTLTVTGVLV